MEDIISKVIAYIIILLIVTPVIPSAVSAFNPKYKTKTTHKLERFVEIYIDQTLGRFDRFIQKRLPILLEKWGEVMVRAMAKIIAIGVTIFLIFHEFPELRVNQNFMGFLIIWGMYAILVLWFDYRKTKSEPLEDKMDKLINKMDELISEVKNNKRLTGG